jgi:hypothetical protein
VWSVIALSKRALLKKLGVSQPRIVKLESGGTTRRSTHHQRCQAAGDWVRAGRAAGEPQAGTGDGASSEARGYRPRRRFRCGGFFCLDIPRGRSSGRTCFTCWDALPPWGRARCSKVRISVARLARRRRESQTMTFFMSAIMTRVVRLRRSPLRHKWSKEPGQREFKPGPALAAS